MGWCSATFVFDKMAKFVIDSTSPEDDKFDVLRELASVLEGEDWDCQYDSDYITHPLVRKVMHALHPDWDDFQPTGDLAYKP